VTFEASPPAPVVSVLKAGLRQSDGMDGSRQPAARKTIRVWDPFVRVFHWAFATTVLVALVTAIPEQAEP
jgi:hypothetical protein